MFMLAFRPFSWSMNKGCLTPWNVCQKQELDTIILFIIQIAHVINLLFTVLYTMHKRVDNNHTQSHNHAQGIKKASIT